MSRGSLQAESQTDTCSGKLSACMGNTSTSGIQGGGRGVPTASAPPGSKQALPLFCWWGSQKIGHGPKSHRASKWQSQKLNSDLPLKLSVFFFLFCHASFPTRMQHAEGRNPMLWLIWTEAKLGEEMVDSSTGGRISLSEFQNLKQEKKEHSAHACSRH